MRILVFEYITGGGMLGRDLPRALVEEGEMVLASLVSDLAEVGGIEILIVRDARLPVPKLEARYCVVREAAEFFKMWNKCLDSVDAVWPVVPEFNRLLEDVSERVIASGKILLNSPPKVLQLVASKIATVNHLSSHGIATVPTYLPEQGVPDEDGMWVIKPDDGVGCQDISICKNKADLNQKLCSLPVDQSYVVQPFVRGSSVSLTILAKDGDATLLSVNHQQMAVTNGAFVLLGLMVNGLTEGLEKYRDIAVNTAAAIPGLWGLLGIDLIATNEGVLVLEINPRLSRSYAGLKESIGSNPAKMVLDLALGSRLPDPICGKAVNVDFEYAGR